MTQGPSADKILAVLASIFILSVCVVIAITPTATGYEASIYDAYPWYFCGILAASNVCGLCILIRRIFSLGTKSSWWIAGLGIVLCTNSLFLALPFLHGYAFFPRGDALTHVGRMKDILTTGSIGETNFYPAVHLLGITLLHMTGLNLEAIPNMLFISWHIMYVLAMYVLGKAVAQSREGGLLIAAFSSPLMFSFLNIVIHPAMLSLFVVPLLLYFYHRQQNYLGTGAEDTLLIVVLVFSVMFAHPVTGLFVGILFLGFCVSNLTYGRLLIYEERAPCSNTSITPPLTVVFLISTIFFIWYFPFSSIQASIREALEFLVYGGRASVFEEYTKGLAMSGAGLFLAAKVFIWRYGVIVAYAAMSLVAVGVVVYTSLCRRAKPKQAIFVYAFLFIVAIIVSSNKLWGFSEETHATRISRDFLVISPILNGLVIYHVLGPGTHFFRSRVTRRMLIGIIAIFIIGAAVLPVFNVYSSPRTERMGLNASEMQIVGTKWFSNHQDRRIAVAEAGINLERFEDFNFGKDSHSFKRAIVRQEPVPPHFGYSKSGSIADTMDFEDEHIYLLTSEIARAKISIVPKKVRHDAYIYEQQDFARLRKDRSVIEIYANGDFEVWELYRK